MKSTVNVLREEKASAKDAPTKDRAGSKSRDKSGNRK